MSTRSDKRVRLMDAAERLFHHRGYSKTSIQDVALAAKVPLGNVFYYFRTKDALVSAVVERRNGQVKERHAGYEAADPRGALQQFLERIHEGAEDRALHGCPMGGLCQEANKLGGPVAETAASTMGLSLDFLIRQYAALGLKPKAAKAAAVSLLAGVQGAILLSHTFNDPALLRAEMRRLQAGLPHAAKES